MNELSTKKRDWIKNAVIVFLIVMLILTFFSNTVMNYSLPEVSAEYVTSGSITAKVRGSGTVTASDPYEVSINESRKVTSIAVKKGDVVQKGDVLLYLEEGDSTELREAERLLDEMVAAYEAGLLGVDVDVDTTTNVQTGNTTSFSTFQNQINTLKQEIKVIEDEAEEIEDERDIYKEEIVKVQDLLRENEKKLNDAKSVLENANNDVAETKSDMDGKLVAAQAVGEKANLTINSKGDALEALNNAVITDETDKATLKAYIDSAEAYEKADKNQKGKKTAVDQLERENGRLNDVIRINQNHVNKLETELSLKSDAIADKNDEISDILNKLTQENSLTAEKKAINEQREIVNQLREKNVGTEVTAPISGEIDSITIAAGNTTEAGTAFMVIQPEGQTYTMQVTVTSEQAQRLSPGDVAEVQNSWYYSDIVVTLEKISNDPASRGQNKILLFNVEGDVSAGQGLSISIGQKSANYSSIVPNSAIREDSNGNFILVVVQKSSPLGNRYYAERLGVEILGSDDTHTAVNGALTGGEFVITTSTKPVEAGQLVRLPD